MPSIPTFPHLDHHCGGFKGRHRACNLAPKRAGFVGFPWQKMLFKYSGGAGFIGLGIFVF